MTNLVKLIRQEQLKRCSYEHLSWWTSTWSALLRYPYIIITLESAVSRTNFPCFWYLNFMKITFLGFHVVVIVKTFPLMIDVWITNVGLMLTKLKWFQPVSVSQNSITNFLKKKSKCLGFHAVVLVKTFPSMYQLLM